MTTLLLPKESKNLVPPSQVLANLLDDSRDGDEEEICVSRLYSKNKIKKMKSQPMRV